MPPPQLKSLVQAWRRMNGEDGEAAAREDDSESRPVSQNQTEEHAMRQNGAAAAESAEHSVEPLINCNTAEAAEVPEPPPPPAAASPENIRESIVDVEEVTNRQEEELVVDDDQPEQRPMQQEDAAVERPRLEGRMSLRGHWHPVDQPVELLQNGSNERRVREEDQEDEHLDNEESDQAQGPSEEAKDKKLGPCAVCGAQSAGFHFGAFTCEGCKSFYGRYNNKEKPVCDKQGNCNIQLELRRTCRGCRYKKCLEVNMNRANSQFGRRPANFQYTSPTAPSAAPEEQENTAPARQPASEVKCEPEEEVTVEEERPVTVKREDEQEYEQENVIDQDWHQHLRREQEIQEQERQLRWLQQEARRIQEQERRLQEQLRREQELHEQERQLREQLKRDQDDRQRGRRLEDERRHQERQPGRPQRDQDEVQPQRQRHPSQEFLSIPGGHRHHPYAAPQQRAPMAAVAPRAAAPRDRAQPLLAAQAAAGPRLHADMLRFLLLQHQQLLARHLDPPAVQLPPSPPLEGAGSPQLQVVRRQSPGQQASPQPSPPQAHSRAAPVGLPQEVALQLRWRAQQQQQQRERQLLPSVSSSMDRRRLPPDLAQLATAAGAELAQLAVAPRGPRPFLPPPESSQALDVNRNMPMVDAELWRRFLEPCSTCGEVSHKCYCDNPPIDLRAAQLRMPGNLSRR